MTLSTLKNKLAKKLPATLSGLESSQSTAAEDGKKSAAGPLGLEKNLLSFRKQHCSVLLTLSKHEHFKQVPPSKMGLMALTRLPGQEWMSARTSAAPRQGGRKGLAKGGSRFSQKSSQTGGIVSINLSPFLLSYSYCSQNRFQEKE